MLNELIDSNTAPVLVHSDLLFARFAIPRGSTGDRALELHYDLLRTNFGDRLIFPVFNYDFPKTRIFDVENTESQLGIFPEYFRKKYSVWRSPVPVFSVCGTGQAPTLNKLEDPILPFGSKSVFAHLHNEAGTLLFYGAPFSSNTYIHYVENLMTPLYRYDKEFEGEIKQENRIEKHKVAFHVRPFNCAFDYDWSRLKSDLEKNGIIRTSSRPELKNIFAIECQKITQFWTQQLKADPFYLINQEARAWVEPLYKKLGRRFLKEDFE